MKYLALLITLVIQNAVCIDYDNGLDIELQHSLNCGAHTFCHRGSIALMNVRAGFPVINQISLSSEHINELKQLAELDGFYTIKSIVSIVDGGKDVREFLSSVKARDFVQNGLSDVINAWILPNGAVIGVNFQVANNSNPIDLNTSNEYKIKSSFYLREVDQAPVPDTASYIQKLEREREAREKGELKDNRSFLAKYWMYIVPIAIFVMISGAANPEPAQASR